MGKPKPELTRAEWAIMDALWGRRRATATDLQTDLGPSQNWAYSTVKTMLDRLVEKGYVSARRVGNVYEYSPKVGRPAAVGRALDELADRLLEGAVGPFMQRLIGRGRLTPDEVAELREILSQYDTKQGEDRR